MVDLTNTNAVGISVAYKYVAYSRKVSEADKAKIGPAVEFLDIDGEVIHYATMGIPFIAVVPHLLKVSFHIFFQSHF